MSLVYGHGGCYGVKQPSIGEITRIGKYRLCLINGKVFEVTSGQFKIGDYYCCNFQAVSCKFYPAKIIGLFTLCDERQIPNGVAVHLESGMTKIFPSKQCMPARIICDGVVQLGNIYYYEEFSKKVPYNSQMQFLADGNYIYRWFNGTITDARGDHEKKIDGQLVKWGSGCVIYSKYTHCGPDPQGAWYFDTLPIIAPLKTIRSKFLPELSNERFVDDTEVKIKNETKKIHMEYHETIAKICVDAVVTSAEKLSQKITAESNLESELEKIKGEYAEAKNKLDEYTKHLECAICFTETKRRAAYSCGHMNVCQDCDSDKIKECPICKTAIMLRFKVIIP